MGIRTAPGSQEFLLVAACSIWPTEENAVASVIEASDAQIDWGRFLRIVRRHRVEGLVYTALRTANVAPPEQINSTLHQTTLNYAGQNLKMAVEAARLSQLFEGRGIPLLFLKGLTLSKLAYGDIGIRHSKDIDVLVLEKDIEAASQLLEEQGYIQHVPATELNPTQRRSLHKLRKNATYVHRERDIEVELHWRLIDNPYMLGSITNRSDQQSIAITRSIVIPTLCDVELFAYLCAHGANDGWFRLKWLADVNALLRKPSICDPAHFFNNAERLGAGPAAAQALLLCERILKAPLPRDLSKSLRQRLRVRLLERIGLWAMRTGDEEVALPDVKFGGTRIYLSHFLLGHGWRYSIRELQIFLTSEEDMALLKLPHWLGFLYPLLRVPLWAARELARALISLGRALSLFFESR